MLYLSIHGVSIVPSGNVLIKYTDSIYIVSIDPGNFTGIAIYELDSVTLAIINITTYVVVLNNYIKHNEEILLARNAILNSVCTDLSYRYNPVVLAMESAFLNSRFPKAVMQLSQYTSTVEQAFYRNNSFIKIYRYPPKYIKKYIGGGGGADKEAMLKAVMSIPELSNRLSLDRLTDHEIDALAIGYITIVNIRKYPHALISF